MVPPVTIRYYYSVEVCDTTPPALRMMTTAGDALFLQQSITALKEGEGRNFATCRKEIVLSNEHPTAESLPRDPYIILPEMTEAKVPRTNVISNLLTSRKLIRKTFLAKMVCVPRP